MTTVKKVKSYYISPKTYTIEPIEYEGKTCSRVSEKSSVYIVEKSRTKSLMIHTGSLVRPTRRPSIFQKGFWGTERKSQSLFPTSSFTA